MSVTKIINNPDVTLSEIMERWPQTIPIFLKHKMMCVGCVITAFHTIEDACLEHDVSEVLFRQELLQKILNT